MKVKSSLFGALKVDDKLADLFSSSKESQPKAAKASSHAKTKEGDAPDLIAESKKPEKRKKEKRQAAAEDSKEQPAAKKSKKSSGKSKRAKDEHAAREPSALAANEVALDSDELAAAVPNTDKEASIGKKKKHSVSATAHHSDPEDEQEKITKPLLPQSSAETRREKVQKLIEKNQRTVFVGNLPTSVIEKVLGCGFSLQEETKQLKDYFGAYGQLESIRFRSVAFSEKMPRKQAFLAKKLHPGRDSLNAYIVFESASDAAKALELNGKLFLGRHLRVDASEQTAEKKRDSKRCIFVGNLPFNISEETMWTYFGDIGEIEYVRVIRDHKTNVGKGFGYVQFVDKSTVSLALKLNGGLLEGRNLRITRASEQLAQAKTKTLPAAKVVEGTRAVKGDTVKLRAPKKPLKKRK
ncbi:Nucleolar protein 12 [Kappamyces sp. JEL0829]|nr:Nucleolar protein 12 [Kappamyces sp. JEL0829]